MTHDVTFVDQFWDPNVRRVASVARIEHNLDRTRTWGMQVAYQRPLPDSAWRIGGVFTSNLLSHPKLPDYQIQEVQSIPWDPGHSAAYNLGIGVGQRRGGTTFGLDAIYEPILTHTWGEAEAPIETTRGITIPAGAKTIENHFRFSNAILRTGIGQDIKLEGIAAPMQIQLGIALHAIHYWFDQFDHVQAASRSQEERWLEWTRTWGMNFRFDRVELRYAGRSTSGTGRPGITRTSDKVFAAADALASSFVPAPNGPLTLTDVRVTTHQISVSLPIR
jgi:hypothetical protein